MAGRGPAPKNPSRRARTNADPIGTKYIAFRKGTQPALPDGVDWPDPTRRWWADWSDASQSETFTDLDWSFLLDTALLHKAMWEGDLKSASELRLRVAKVGQTPEDRARLRIQFASADEADDKRDRRSRSAEARYGDIKLLPGVAEGS